MQDKQKWKKRVEGKWRRDWTMNHNYNTQFLMLSGLFKRYLSVSVDRRKNVVVMKISLFS